MNYGKAALAVLGTVLSAVIAALVGDAIVSAVEWVNVAIAGTGAAAVFASPNVPGARYTKVILSTLTGVLVLLSSLILGGLDTSEVLQLAVAALTAAGVYMAPYTYIPPTNEYIDGTPRSV